MKWMVLLVFFALYSLFISTNGVFAQTAKDSLTIQTIWVTGNNSCYHNDVQRLNEYQNEVILKYLFLYGIHPLTYPVQCMNEAVYDSYQPPDYTDLIIVIYNKNIGRDLLHSRNMGGYFQTGDQISKHGLKIVVCECEGYNFNDAIWVLSHELSHFSLFYLGLPQSIWVDWVHDVQNKYYTYCPDGDTTNSNCNGLWQKYSGTNRNYKVMAINKMAYGKTPPQVKFVNYVSSQEQPQSSINANNALQKLQSALDNQVTKTTSDSQYRDLAFYSKINYQDQLDKLKSGIIIAEDSLSGLTYQNPASQKKIEQAWNERYNALESLEYAKAKWIEGQDKINKGEFQNSVSAFKEIDEYSDDVGNSLKWISAAIRDAENMENDYKSKNNEEKFCFLFWCW